MPDLGNTTVFSQVDASNNTGTQPSWSGSAAPSTLDNAGRALQGAVFREWNWRNFTVSTTNSSNDYTATYSVSPDAYYNGQTFGLIVNAANTGAATLRINALAAKSLKKLVAGVKTALSSGDLAAGMFILVAYNTSDDSFLWVNRGEIPSSYYSPGGTDVALADGGTGASLTDPNADRILFWDDSGGAVTWLTAGSGLAISSTTLAVDIAGLSADATPDTAADYVMTLDATDSTLKKVLIDDFLPAQSGGVTFIDTITTTSGTSQTLGSLTLTDYKFLKLVMSGVSHNSGTNAWLSFGNSASDDVQATDTHSAASLLTGIMEIDLSNGVGFSAYRTSAGGTQVVYAFDSAITTASTAIYVEPSGGSFDAGSIRVYGIK